MFLIHCDLKCLQVLWCWSLWHLTLSRTSNPQPEASRHPEDLKEGSALNRNSVNSVTVKPRTQKRTDAKKRKEKLQSVGEVCHCKHLGKHNFQLIVASSLLPIIPNCTSPRAHSNPDHFQMQIAALHSNLTQQRGESICIHKLAAIAISFKRTICIKSRGRSKTNRTRRVKFRESNNERLGLFNVWKKVGQ